MPPDPADLTDTILTATDGSWRTEYGHDSIAWPGKIGWHQNGQRCDIDTHQRRSWTGPVEPIDAAQDGDPRPVAARQAAATLRWLADNCTWTAGRPRFWSDDDLRELANQLDTQETP